MNQQLKRLKEIHSKGLITYAEVAEALGVSPNTVSRWNSGQSKPRVINLRKLDKIICEFS